MVVSAVGSRVEKLKIRLEEIRRENKELKEGGNFDPSSLKEETSSFINIVKSEDEG